MIRTYAEWGGVQVIPSQLPVGSCFDSIQQVLRGGKEHWFKVRFLVVLSKDIRGGYGRFYQECTDENGNTLERDLGEDEIAWYSELVT